MLLALGLSAAAALAASSSGASTGSTVVGANVLSSTSITDACTAPAARQLGSLTTNSSQVTSAPCRFDFASSNSTASLRISQLDGQGTAMTQGAPTVWSTQQSFPTTNAIDVVDSLVTFAGQSDGTIDRTANDGNTWTAETSNTTAAINDIAAIDATNAYAVTGCFFGCPGVRRRTTGGGTNWATQTVPGAVTGQLRGVDFVPSTPNTAVAVGSGGKIIRTTDGGTTWSVVASGTTENLLDVDLVSATAGYAVGANGTVLRTPDAGATWLAVNTPAAGVSLSRVSSPAAGTVFISSQDAIYRSQNADGAATWTPVTPPGSVFTDVLALSVSEVYVSSWWGLARSADANVATPTWSNLPSPSDDFIASIDADSSMHLKAGAWNGVVFSATSMAGPWNIDRALGSNVASVDARNRTTLMAVGSLGLAWRSTDGATWTAVPTGSRKNLAEVTLVSATEAWVAGSAGSLFHTTNLGTIWTEVLPGAPGTPNFQDVLRTDSGALLAVGSGGTIVRSIDDGTTWTVIASGTGTELRALDQAPDGGRLWIVGQNGTILTSTDDGRTWTDRSSGTSALYGVTATSANAAYVAGTSDTVLRTSDGGASWSAVTGLPSAEWYDVDSAGPNVIAVVGGASQQRSISTDGGATWTTSTGIFNISGVKVLDANTIWAGGTGGTIMLSAPAATIPDFTNWSTAGFGACLQSVGLSAAIDQWAVANGGTCDVADATEFRPVPTSPLTIARTGLAGDLGRADLYWGLRVGSATPPGAYTAHVRFEVVAPAV